MRTDIAAYPLLHSTTAPAAASAPVRIVIQAVIIPEFHTR